MNDPVKTGMTVSSRVGLAKDMLSLLRDGVLVLLFLLLLLTPGFVGDRLASAGFEEGEFVGFKWKKQAKVFGKSVQDLDAELKDANATVLRLTGQLRSNEKELDALRRMNLSGATAERVASLQAGNQQIVRQATSQTASIAKTLASSRAVVVEAREIAPSGSKLGLVLGGDQSLDQAQYEVGVLSRSGIGNLAIYRKGGSFRTVAVTESRATANDWRNKALPRRPDAYIVSLRSWCATPRSMDGFLEC